MNEWRLWEDKKNTDKKMVRNDCKLHENHCVGDRAKRRVKTNTTGPKKTEWEASGMGEIRKSF